MDFIIITACIALPVFYFYSIYQNINESKEILKGIRQSINNIDEIMYRKSCRLPPGDIPIGFDLTEE